MSGEMNEAAASKTGKAAKGSYRDLRAVIRSGRPPYGVIVLAILISLVEIASTLWFPIITRELIDTIPTRETSAAGLIADPLVGTLLGILVLGAVAGGVSNYLLSKVGYNVVRTLKGELFRRMVARPVPYFDRHESGELVSRLTNDTGIISTLVTKSLSGLVSGILMLIGSAVILYLLDPPLTIIIFAIILGTFALVAPIIMKLSRITVDINDSTASFAANVSRAFGEIRLVKAFSAEKFEGDHMDRELSGIYKNSIRLARIEAILQPANGLALTAAMLTIFAYGGARIELGTLTIGTLTAFILYIFNIVAPLIQLSTFFSQVQSSKGASSRLAEFLDAPPPPTLAFARASGPKSAIPAHRELVFDQVRFGYGDPAKPVVEIDLRFAAGSRTGIIGPSGSGKTTLFSLVEQFYLPTSGAITYGGTDIRTFDLAEWRGRIGYVPQAAPLMKGSIRDNICYGLTGPVDEAAVEAAVEAANCMEFVRQLDGGLDAQVGEGGSLLSGGQKQRIAIARIFYRDPEILLLDEATSSLDERNEAEILQALYRLTSNRTALIITHRLTTIRDMERVLILEGGKVAAIETPADILADRDRIEALRRALEQDGR